MSNQGTPTSDEEMLETQITRFLQAAQAKQHTYQGHPDWDEHALHLTRSGWGRLNVDPVVCQTYSDQLYESLRDMPPEEENLAERAWLAKAGLELNSSCRLPFSNVERILRQKTPGDHLFGNYNDLRAVINDARHNEQPISPSNVLLVMQGDFKVLADDFVSSTLNESNLDRAPEVCSALLDQAEAHLRDHRERYNLPAANTALRIAGYCKLPDTEERVERIFALKLPQREDVGRMVTWGDRFSVRGILDAVEGAGGKTAVRRVLPTLIQDDPRVLELIPDRYFADVPPEVWCEYANFFPDTVGLLGDVESSWSERSNNQIIAGRPVLEDVGGLSNYRQLPFANRRIPFATQAQYCPAVAAAVSAEIIRRGLYSEAAAEAWDPSHYYASNRSDEERMKVGYSQLVKQMLNVNLNDPEVREQFEESEMFLFGRSRTMPRWAREFVTPEAIRVAVTGRETDNMYLNFWDIVGDLPREGGPALPQWLVEKIPPDVAYEVLSQGAEHPSTSPTGDLFAPITRILVPRLTPTQREELKREGPEFWSQTILVTEFPDLVEPNLFSLNRPAEVNTALLREVVASNPESLRPYRTRLVKAANLQASRGDPEAKNLLREAGLIRKHTSRSTEEL